MSSLLEKLEKEVLSLTPSERAFLADRLLGTLGEEALSEVDKIWIDEAEKRYHDYKKGNRPGIDANLVFSEADRLIK